MALEKDDLLVKIEAGEGASTALTQLKQGRQNSIALFGTNPPISDRKVVFKLKGIQSSGLRIECAKFSSIL